MTRVACGMDQCVQCDGCALKPGAEANRESHNHLTAAICALGAIPFYCHDSLDWESVRDVDALRGIRSGDVHQCAGWRRAVRLLAAAGWFRPPLSRVRIAYAKSALTALREIRAGIDDPEEKAAVWRTLRGTLGQLASEARELCPDLDIFQRSERAA